ncbi:MAG: hypothetical protein A2015_05615 [Spirochaetes bacterium GWF1_31_7]|nr:MAG: hypothetical protein A2Y30_04595 [Spirochaetes bacterium GWE1_32_154]OHD46351.1 MAG: hypothetical protein A2Y29_04310 [Spirochaetes bacterium GWE2_31_10]OHD52567.1 MAG: hypothetical protein A2015_05615 [Spirochaetes bacterium GWF1_31_7]
MQLKTTTMIHADCTISDFEIKPDAELSLKKKACVLKNELFYHIWIPAFYDSNNDGTGDINGITIKLDYLASLGIKGIWLSPFFECDYKGDNMHGYDTTDFYSVNPRLGTIEDIKNLLHTAHTKGISILFDLPMNHTSHAHPWFIDSKKGGAYKDWYIWNEAPGDGWHIIWDEARAKKTWHSHSDSHYYGVFSGYMPDLNFVNNEVRNEMARIITYWLNMGFDGVRIDGARYIYEDGPEKISDTQRTHLLFQTIRKDIFDKYSETGYSKLLIAEAWGEKEIIRNYYGNNDEFHSCFNFPLTQLIPDLINNVAHAETKINGLIEYQLTHYPEKYLGGIFLTNHDLAGNRPATEFKNDHKKMALAAAIQFFLPGTPFVYYGNEVGMHNANLKGDMKLRSKMEWEKQQNDNAVFKSYNALCSVYNTILNDFEDIDFAFHGANKGILSFVRIGSGKRIVFLFNYTGKMKTIDIDPLKYGGVTIQHEIINGRKLDHSEILQSEQSLPAYSFCIIVIS